MTTALRLLLAVVLGVALVFGWQMYREREARLAGQASPEAASDSGAAPRAGTAKLYKCLDAAGATSIQSDPCAAGSRTAWVRDATPEPGGAPTTVIDSAGATAADGTTGAQPVSFACEMALADRASYRAGKKGAITDEGLALRDATVDEACR